MQFGKPMTIEEFIDATFDDPEHAKELRDDIRSRLLAKSICVERVLKDVSREEMQVRARGLLTMPVDTIETSHSLDISLKDVRAYAAALGVVFTIEIDGTGVVDVKFRDKEIAE